jgi:ubiquinone/menaquinone biosynthesis C-methylase UbiE
MYEFQSFAAGATEHEKSQMKTNEKTYSGEIARLRRPERMAALEIPRVVDLCLAEISAATVLDVGCGSGIFSEAFLARGLFCAGVDLNPAMLGATRTFAKGAHVVASVADNLPFCDMSFDMVFMAHLLHEVDDPAATLKEALRVCKKRIAVLEWPYRQEEMGPPLGHRLSPEAMGTAALRAGLTSVKPVVLKNLALYLIDI